MQCFVYTLSFTFLVRHSRDGKLFTADLKYVQEKIPNKDHRETQSWWVAAKERWDQRKFHFHMAMGKMFLSITRRNLYIITEGIFALGQTQNLLTESKAVKGL